MITSALAIIAASGGLGGSTVAFPINKVTPDGFYFDMEEADKYQDDAFTTAISADAQTVGSITDQAGFNDVTVDVAGQEPEWEVPNNSLIFDGTDDHLKSGLHPSNTAMTYIVKFRADLAVAGTQVLIGSAIGTERAWLSLTDGVLSTGVGGNGSDTTKDPGATDLRSSTEWYVAAVSWDATDIWLYLDGVEVLNETRLAGGADNAADIYIGARNTSLTNLSEDNQFTGEISHAFCSTSVITPSDHLAIANHMKPPAVVPVQGDSTRWRIKVDQSGSNQFLSIQEIEMAVTLAGGNECTGGTATAGTNRTGWTASEAFDGDKTTVSHGWSVNIEADLDRSEWWIEYEFATTKEIKEVRLFARQDENAFHMPVSWHLEFWDGTQWVTQWDVIYEDYFTNEESRTYTASSDPRVSGAHRYWRVRLGDSDNGAYGHIAELEMRQAIGGADTATTGQAISGDERVSFPDTEAFDNIVSGNNSWGVQFSLTALADRWVGQDYTTPVTIKEVELTARADSFPNQNPNTFFVEASSDNVTWNPVWYVERAKTSAWVASEAIVFTDPHTSAEEGQIMMFALLGQSNMIGRDGPIISPEDDTDADILMFQAISSTFITAADPLDHFGENAGEIGAGLTFAKDILSNDSPRKVILVGMAEGGTGFIAGNWLPNRTSTTYENARARWNDAIANAQYNYGYESVKVSGALWIQGEDEVADYASLFNTASTSRYEYMTMPLSMFEIMRAGDFHGWAADTPLAFGQIAPGSALTPNTPAYTEIQAGITEVGSLTENASHAVGTDLTTADTLHYDSTALRTMGNRLYTAMVTARTATSGITIQPPEFIRDASNIETAFAFSAVGVSDGAPIVMQEGSYPLFENKRVRIEGGAMQFDGDAELRFSKNASRQDRPDLDDKDFVFKCTFTTTSATEQGIWSLYDTVGNQRSFVFRVNTGPVIQFYTSDNGTSATLHLSHSISISTEYDIEIRRVGTALTLHVDGVLQDSDTLAGAYTVFDPTSLRMNIGDHINNRELIGEIVSLSLEYI